MQLGSESEVVRARWLAVGAFIALSLPLVFVGEPSEPEAASQHRPLRLQHHGALAPALQPEAKLTAVMRSPAKAPAKRKRIVVSISERRLAVVQKAGVVKSYPIAVGADTSPSPTGQFKIVNKVTDPTYYSPGIIITPGPANPLGTRWLGLDKEQYGIHGTNEPESIGQAASHGCIRMAKTDVKELFSLAGIGDTVEISDEPLRVLAQLDEVMSEAGEGH
jgi:lipoprotein-anchoring transpeptidase ErfK/SrfK